MRLSEERIRAAAELEKKLAADPEKAKLLGLSGTTPDATGAELRPGDRVELSARVLRIHASGFAVLEVEGESAQPAILAHGRNLRRKS